VIAIGEVFTAFALILPSELPDKTFIATLVLATQYRRIWVWLGVSAAFAVQTLIAVVAGGLLALLPSFIVGSITMVLFAAGSAYMIRSGLRSRSSAVASMHHEQTEVLERVRVIDQPWKALGISFSVIFIAEWGDLSQLLTAGLAARSPSPLSIGIGAWLALISIAALAVLAGEWLHDRVPVWRIRLISGALLLGLAMWSGWELLYG
jgi:Ca2+/H+ antiporter, TMEM165/GDT1 family